MVGRVKIFKELLIARKISGCAARLFRFASRQYISVSPPSCGYSWLLSSALAAVVRCVLLSVPVEDRHHPRCFCFSNDFTLTLFHSVTTTVFSYLTDGKRHIRPLEAIVLRCVFRQSVSQPYIYATTNGSPAYQTRMPMSVN